MAKSDSDQEAGKPKPGEEVKKPRESKPKTAVSKTPSEKPKKTASAAVAPKAVKTKTAEPVVVAETAPVREEKDPVLATADGNKAITRLIVRVTAIVVGIIAIVVLIFGILVYGYKSENPVVKAVAKVVPYPVERVNGQFVSYNNYLFEVDANERAYQNNAKLNNQPAVDFNSADGKKLVIQIKHHALDKLKSDAVVAQLAKQKGVVVTDKQVNDLINQLYQRYGGKDTLLKTLNQIYGWNLGDLQAVVRKQLLAQNLQDKVTSDPSLDAAAKATADNVLNQIKAGGDFSALAKKNSQASDASSGGDLGYFTKGQLPDNEQAAAEALQPGSVSDVIKTQYGYEIIKVLDKKDDGSIHAQHILIKTVDFNTYFQDQLNKAKVDTYIKA